MPREYNVPTNGVITIDEINAGEWGVYSFSAIEKKFKENITKIPAYNFDSATSMYGEIRHNLEQLVDVSRTEMTDFEMMVLSETLRETIPKRKEHPTGDCVFETPIRSARPGAAKSRIPKKGPDVFKYIFKGAIASSSQPISGHAIILATNHETEELELDNPFSLEIKNRDISNLPMISAYAIINRFQTFIRHQDPRIAKLITKVRPPLVNYTKNSNSIDGVVSLPYGINIVTFPVDYIEDLSETSIYNMFSMLKATQQAIKIVREAYRDRTLFTGDEKDRNGLQVEDTVTDVFMNIGPLVGGTIPRIHTQAYVRARTLRHKCYEREPSRILREQHNEFLSERIKNGEIRGQRHIVYENRSCNLFSISIPSVPYETKIELKDECKSFTEYSPKEIWDLSEILIFDSLILDKLLRGIKKDEDYSGKERNVIFYETGVVIRPFAFVGGIEQGYPALITPLTTERFEQEFSELAGKRERRLLPESINSVREEDCTRMYIMPKAKRSQKEYIRLVDQDSHLFNMASLK